MFAEFHILEILAMDILKAVLYSESLVTAVFYKVLKNTINNKLGP
jgi:hypothetical protein